MTILIATPAPSKAMTVTIPSQSGTETIEVDFQTLQGKELAKVDCVYPDLSTQATHAIRDIEEIKNSMLNSIAELLFCQGYDVMCNQLDGIYNYLLREKELLDDGSVWDIGDFAKIAGNVYSLIKMAKTMLSLHFDGERLKHEALCLEYVQKGVSM